MRVITIAMRQRQAIAMAVYIVGLFVDYLSDTLGRRQMRAMERLCLEQAGLCALPESRAALEEMARNYRAAAEHAASAARCV